ncbi:MAG: alpha/beta fold hydrolase, partial [Acidimicrobiales bacterium]
GRRPAGLGVGLALRWWSTDMKITKARVAAEAVLAAGVAAAAASAATAAFLRRWASQPDPAQDEDFSEPTGTVHRILAAEDGGQIHVVERGAGRPFLLIHGVTNSTEIWHYQLRDLVEAGYRAVAMDVRGHGRSKAGTDEYSLAAMAADAYRVICDLGLRDVVAVGHSMGGMILLQLVADHPELMTDGTVTALVLVATAARPVIGSGLPSPATRLGRALTLRVARGFCRAVESAERAAALPDAPHSSNGKRPRPDAADRRPLSVDWRLASMRLIFGSRPSLTLVQRARALSATVPPELVEQLFLTLLELDVRATLGSIRQPVLIVVGTRDTITPVWHARLLARRLPVAELHVLPGSGHVVPFERPDELTWLLTDFAARSEPVADLPAPSP